MNFYFWGLLTVFLTLFLTKEREHRLLGASPPPAPTAYGLRPRFALPPGIPQGLRPSRVALTPLIWPPKGAEQIPRSSTTTLPGNSITGPPRPLETRIQP